MLKGAAVKRQGSGSLPVLVLLNSLHDQRFLQKKKQKLASLNLTYCNYPLFLHACRLICEPTCEAGMNANQQAHVYICSVNQTLFMGI